jgi:3-methyl-2-oxobutanoate hydroxymethyltransferase
VGDLIGGVDEALFGLVDVQVVARLQERGDVGGELRRAATQYADEVASGIFPGEEHSF